MPPPCPVNISYHIYTVLTTSRTFKLLDCICIVGLFLLWARCRLGSCWSRGPRSLHWRWKFHCWCGRSSRGVCTRWGAFLTRITLVFTGVLSTDCDHRSGLLAVALWHLGLLALRIWRTDFEVVETQAESIFKPVLHGAILIARLLQI